MCVDFTTSTRTGQARVWEDVDRGLQQDLDELEGHL